ncbi:hypothetical protein AMET1_0976 [Methanonatronarchaeum thermophilum]|uniref:Uncharacterized protein n=1 Tax=Methanonatronarchaeum thermophilum TaxID=1927129 RepID=A0A1Y3GDI6_9EURY|nr:hypothetical protein AMET1_0976 [Methanonatronarchaeum thermophilum]
MNAAPSGYGIKPTKLKDIPLEKPGGMVLQLHTIDREGVY